MADIRLHVNKPGLQTLVQDLGRTGYEAFGVPRGGVMDRTAARMANWLVGNDSSAPVIEIAMVGPEIEFEGNGQLAITGARFTPALDGEAINMYESVHFKGTVKLTFGRLEAGCRAYLAIGGSWQTKQWLKSSSAFTFVPDLTPDSQLIKGSEVRISAGKTEVSRSIARALWPNFDSPIKINVMAGPEYDRFEEDLKETFFNTSFVLTTQSDRMGFRLDPPLPGYKQESEVISSGIVKGTIQITNSGQPIVLMADAQTSGGYPRIVNVISAHFDRLAQAKPGDTIQFNLVNEENARLALLDHEGFIRQVLV